MRFTVEVDDFYIEDGELSSELEAAVRSGVVSQIRDQVKDSADRKITEAVKSSVSAIVDAAISEAIAKSIESGEITVNGKPIAISEHLKNVFQSNSGWNNPSIQMAKLAKDFSNSLKAQYDTVYATKLVMSMSEHGFLKDDVSKMLTYGKE